MYDVFLDNVTLSCLGKINFGVVKASVVQRSVMKIREEVVQAKRQNKKERDHTGDN